MKKVDMVSERLFLSPGEQIPIAGIVYLEGDRNYTVIHTFDQKIISSKTLQVLQDRLEETAFVRINKGILLNLSFIKSHRRLSARWLEVEISNGRRFVASRRRVKAYMALLRAACLALLFVSGLNAQTIRFVTEEGGGAKNGTSWANAFDKAQLQPQLAAATAGTQFWVAEGEYRPSYTGDRSKSFLVPSGVQVLGSFEGFEETNVLQGDNITTYFTGNIGNEALETDNSLHVVTFENAAPATLLKRVHITEGYADGGTSGGGIQNRAAWGNSSSPRIEYCEIEYNKTTSQGAAYAELRTGTPSAALTTFKPFFFECLFSGNVNTSFTNKGSVYSLNALDKMLVEASFENCLFEYNSATHLSALVTDGEGRMTFTHCEFTDDENPQGTFIDAIATKFSGTSVTKFVLKISSSEFRGAEASAIRYNRNNGTANVALLIDSVYVTKSIFRNNSSAKGGVYSQLIEGRSNLSTVFEKCKFLQNSAITGGVIAGTGGTAAATARLELLNCLFESNTTSGATGSRRGGVLLVENAGNVTMTNCTFVKNFAHTEAAVVYAQSPNVTTVAFRNSLLYGNRREGSTVPSNFNFSGGTNPFITQSTFVESTVTPNPRFLSYGSNNYALAQSSPCVNAGSNLLLPSNVITDLKENDRVAGAAVDQGCFENQYTANTKIYFVGTSAQGDSSGINWDNCLSRFQLRDSLANAPANSQFWLLQGTYKPTYTTIRTHYFTVPDFVAVYGGFDKDHSAPKEREGSRSTLSGNIGGDDGFFPEIIFDDNSYHVMKLIDSKSVLLDGLTFERGYANGTGDENDGGGLFVKYTLLGINAIGLFNCEFRYNFADGVGGGMYCSYENSSGNSPSNYGAFFKLYNTGFISNRAGSSGGGFYYSNNAGNNATDMVNCLFAENTSQNSSGGGLYISGNQSTGTVRVTNCTIVDNDSFTSSGGLRVVQKSGDPWQAEVRNSILWNNRVNGDTTAATAQFGKSPSNARVKFRYCDVQRISPDSITCFSANPLLSGSYRLRSNSPCINRGDSTAVGLFATDPDLDGDPRFVNGGVDLGCFEENSCPDEPVSITTTQSGGFINLTNDTEIEGKNLILPATKVIYSARNTIELKPGFEAKNGAVFKAEIGGCPFVGESNLIK